MTARAPASKGEWRPISPGDADRKHFPALAFHVGTTAGHRVSICRETTKYQNREEHGDGPGSACPVGLRTLSQVCASVGDGCGDLNRHELVCRQPIFGAGWSVELRQCKVAQRESSKRPGMSEVSGLIRAVQCRSNVAQKITIGIPYSLTHRYSYLTGPVRSGGNA